MASANGTSGDNTSTPVNGSTTPIGNGTTSPALDLSRTSSPRNSKGWDGKLRVEKKAVLTNPEALSDPEYSDEDAPPPEQIQADEDLLEGEDKDVEEIDLVHSRISSIPALHLDRFTKLEKLCLRQNLIQDLEFPSNLSPTLNELDLYDNLVKHIQGLGGLVNLVSLDLSFNKIKHIKNVNHLKELKDLYFVQNRIRRIEGLDGLTKLRNLELGANNIREIENLESLIALEELWLGKNKITQLKGLDSLTNLKILSIQSNRLTSLDNLSALTSLEELHVSYNLLTSLSGISSNTSLRVIDISNNPIEHLADLTTLKNLEELWASYCKLDDFGEIERELKDKEQLNTVYFEGNPLQLRQPVLYRNKVRLALPQVKQIDATFVKLS